MKRRSFIKNTSLAAAGTFLVPEFLKAMDSSPDNTAGKGKVLIVIQLSGGNDGLNTIVPYGDDLYKSNRTKLALNGNELITIDNHVAFNAQLAGLADIFHDNGLAILNSVGYPNPDRSHFRSLDIWHSASHANEYWQTGWIGRYLDAVCKGCGKPYTAIEADDTLSLALKGETVSGIACRDPKTFKLTTANPMILETAARYKPHDDDHHNVEYLRKTLAEASQSAAYIYEHSKIYASTQAYPDAPIGRQLKQVAELICSGSETKIYYVSMPGYDTHALQRGQQNRLLGQYSKALKALYLDLKAAGRWNDTLVMTFSEFGRRVKENAGDGTDHGTANVLMLAGGNLKQKGVINEAPDLKNLVDGDLVHKVDFRNVYATILQNWLEADAEKILGRKFEKMDFV
ncbi:MAG: hypothetical protein FD123_2736 [Bacteroidetes bacterium]|nr:MAG: hypothetical protein FD123_2736 [Bacteroidota bacterium]